MPIVHFGKNFMRLLDEDGNFKPALFFTGGEFNLRLDSEVSTCPNCGASSKGPAMICEKDGMILNQSEGPLLRQYHTAIQRGTNRVISKEEVFVCRGCCEVFHRRPYIVEPPKSGLVPFLEPGEYELLVEKVGLR